MTLRDLSATACLLAVVACASGPLGAQDTPPQDTPPKDTPPDVIQRSGEPYYAGIGRVKNPVLHPDSKVVPAYPKKARKKGLQARCILQAVIEKDGRVSKAATLETRITHKDGSVEKVQWPRKPKEDRGFGAASEEAVTRWRYEPATLDGAPVAVYFTVVVDFVLK